nr:HlyD family efflux transporter periplasmic adaptor subunit [Luteibacter rhizovicinus]
MDDFFRREAVEHAANEGTGGVSVATPLGAASWALGALLVAGGIIAFLLLGTYTHRQRASGILVPQAGTLQVAALTAGRVERILVTEGQSVNAGQTLAILSANKASERLGDTATAVAVQLDAQARALEADIASTAQLSTRQTEDLHMQQAMLARQRDALGLEESTSQHQVDDITSLLTRWQPLLSHGYVSTLDIQAQKNQLLNAQGQVHALEKQRLEIEQQLKSAVDQLAQLPLTTSTKVNDLRRQLAQSRQSLAQSEADRAAVVRAPSAGAVGTILVQPGQSVAAGQNLVALIPAGSALRAELLVPSSAIGFVRDGGDVVLRYAAFPYQKFGLQEGHVESVSKTALTPAELSQMLGEEAAKEPMYRVNGSLASQSVMAYGQAERVRPGMAVEADLMLERRSLLEWMFEPLYGFSRRLAWGRA